MIDIIIYAQHPIFTDALLRSMNMMWINHPIPYIIQDKKDFGTHGILGREHKLKFIEDPSFLTNPFRLILKSDDLFIRPYKLDLNVFQHMPLDTISLKIGKNLKSTQIPKHNVFNPRNYKYPFDVTMFNKTGRIHRNKNNLKTDLSWIPNQSYIIEIDPDYGYAGSKGTIDPRVVTNYDKIYLEGKRLDIYPFLFIENTEYILYPDLWFTWKK